MCQSRSPLATVFGSKTHVSHRPTLLHRRTDYRCCDTARVEVGLAGEVGSGVQREGGHLHRRSQERLAVSAWRVLRGIQEFIAQKKRSARRRVGRRGTVSSRKLERKTYGARSSSIGQYFFIGGKSLIDRCSVSQGRGVIFVLGGKNHPIGRG